MDTENFDLFGVRIPDRQGLRGRPPYEPCTKDENKIKLLLAMGWSEERIANSIGVSTKTLRKYYFPLLKSRFAQRDMMESARMLNLFEQAMAGNVGAHREFSRLMEKNDAMEASRSFRDEPTPPRAEQQKVGKKEQAKLDAEEVASGESAWGDDLLFGVEGS